MDRETQRIPPERALVYRRRRAAASLAAILVVGAVGVLVATAPDDRSPAQPVASSPGVDPARQVEERPSLERVSVGSGARGAEVVREEGTMGGPVVIFFHGWKVAARSDYRDWLSHLAREGNTVIFPTYQNGSTPPAEVLGNSLSGIRSALDLIGEPESIVAAGHSAGAALATDYTAVATEKSLPSPEAVLAIYPGRAILGYPEGIPQADLSQLGAATRIVAMSSPFDTIVGEQPAQDLLAATTRVPSSRKRLVSVSSPGPGDHLAPAGASAAAKRVFWRTLDRLIARV